MPRILVVGEHSLYRMGFCALIKENFTNVEVLETGSMTEAVAHIRSDRGVQLVLIGLRLLHWGYSMNEELRTRKAQSDLRKQKGATSAGRP